MRFKSNSILALLRQEEQIQDNTLYALFSRALQAHIYHFRKSAIDLEGRRLQNHQTGEIC